VVVLFNRQSVGTNCAPFLAVLFLYAHKLHAMFLSKSFYFTFDHIDYVLSLDNISILVTLRLRIQQTVWMQFDIMILTSTLTIRDDWDSTSGLFSVFQLWIPLSYIAILQQPQHIWCMHIIAVYSINKMSTGCNV
jgi:hypothetical protein